MAFGTVWRAYLRTRQRELPFPNDAAAGMPPEALKNHSRESEQASHGSKASG